MSKKGFSLEGLSEIQEVKNEKVKITFHIDKKLNADIKKNWSEKYGLKGRSAWIEEAIKNLLSQEDYIRADFISGNEDALDFVESLEVGVPKNKMHTSVDVSTETEEKLIEAVRGLMILDFRKFRNDALPTLIRSAISLQHINEETGLINVFKTKR